MALDEIKLWNGKSVPRMGIGTWAMGGKQYSKGKLIGWGSADDATSVCTLHTAFEKGVRIIDTSSSYGAGHSERIIARAIRDSDFQHGSVLRLEPFATHQPVSSSAQLEKRPISSHRLMPLFSVWKQITLI